MSFVHRVSSTRTSYGSVEYVINRQKLSGYPVHFGKLAKADGDLLSSYIHFHSGLLGMDGEPSLEDRA